jgi:large subunit ribosomal protein L9
MPSAILLKDVDGVGTKGAVVDVSKGYLRNFLIPRKLAQPATKGALQVAAQLAVSQERAQRDVVSKAHENADLLNKTVLTLAEKAGDDGRLFGSVTTQDIADAIKEARGLTIDKRHIHLDEPIKTTGTFQVQVEVTAGVHATVKTMVTELK